MHPQSAAGSAVPRLSVVALAAVAAALAAFVLLAPMPRVLSIVPDDAAYYFRIAENVSAGKGPTFDGINRTNGFQPLWLAVLVPVCAAYHGEPETMFRIFLALQIAILAAAAVLVQTLLGRFYPPHVVILSGLIFLFWVFVPAVNGMESAILVLSLAVLFLAAAAWGICVRSGARRHFFFGALLGLVVLARLDTVFLPLAIGAACLARAAARRAGDRRFIGEFLCLAAGAALVVAPYLVWNLASFGGFMPISGMLKSSFPAISYAGSVLGHLGTRGYLGLVLGICYLIWFVARYGELKKDASGRLFFQAGMALASGAVVLHALHTILFMRWAVFKWHFVPYAFLGSLIVCEPLSRLVPALRSRRARVIYFLAVAAVLVRGVSGMTAAFHQPVERNWSTAAYEAALWAREKTAPDAIFAMKDAGNFGYFSERSTINLDGVVNDLAYQRTLRDGDLGGYLARNGVAYLVQHAFWDRPDILAGSYGEYRMTYRSRLYGTESDTITVRRGDEAYRSRPYFDGPHKTVFLVWRLRG